MTRPEIAIHVNLLGRLTEDPSANNYQAALKVLVYLQSTKYEGIIIRRPSNLLLEAFADASYGGPESRSQTGYLRQQTQQGLLTIHFVPGRENPADPLTKLLPMTAINQWKTVGKYPRLHVMFVPMPKQANNQMAGYPEQAN